VILFAGTRSDEATASVAAQLCATLVRDGLRVTLVDADRAQPRLNRVFGAPDAPGVADILAGRVGANDALHIGADGRLRFLSAGAPADTAAETTENGLRALFDDLSAPSDTDLVVVSGPSVWAARQVGPLEKAADGMVLVAPDAVPADESVARARRLLSNGYQPRILGVVVGRSVPGDAPVEALPAPTEVNP
jgi:tyrosine-protein kinase Etk/Wzc